MKQEYVYYMIRALTGLTFHMMFTAAGLYRIDISTDGNLSTNTYWNSIRNSYFYI